MFPRWGKKKKKEVGKIGIFRPKPWVNPIYKNGKNSFF